MSDNLVIIDPKENLKTDWLDNQIEDQIEYFPLETPISLPLGVLEKCIVVDTICITTFRNRNGIFFHSLSGRFLHHLRTSGKGPLELSKAQDIAKFDDSNILISDIEKNSILKYNIYERKIVKEYKTKHAIFSMYYSNDFLYYVCNDFENGIVQSVNKFDFENSKILIKGTKISNMLTSSRPFIEIDNDRFLINLSFHDTLTFFNSAKNIIEKECVVGNKETSLKNFPTDKIINAFVVEHKLEKLQPALIPWGFTSKLGNHIIFPVIPSNKCIVVDLKNDHPFLLDFQNNIGKLSYVESGVFPGIIKNDGNEIYSILSISETKPKSDSKIPFDYISNYSRMLEDKFQNPVIARFRLKN